MNDLQKTNHAAERMRHVHSILCEIALNMGPCFEIENVLTAASEAARMLSGMARRMEEQASEAVTPSDDPE